MRMAVVVLLAPLAMLISNVALAQNVATVAGSGVVVGGQGEILTNAHVVEDCKNITVQLPSHSPQPAVLVARDQRNDLALIRMNSTPSSVAAFREGAPLRAGDSVVAVGYPLSGLLATTANLSVGIVSALAGLGDDSRYFQISAPVQPGNSGGPLLDTSGHLVGIVTAKLDAVRVARFTGDIPQNVNFAVKAEVAKAFLDSKGIDYRAVRSDQQLSPADVGDVARPFTVSIECRQVAPQSAAVHTTPSLPTPLPAPSAHPESRWVELDYEDETITYDLTTVQMIERGKFTIVSTTVDHPDVMRLKLTTLAVLRSFCTRPDGMYAPPTKLFALGKPDMPVRKIEVKSHPPDRSGKKFKQVIWDLPYHKTAIGQEEYPEFFDCEGPAVESINEEYSEARSMITNGIFSKELYDCKRGVMGIFNNKDDPLSKVFIFPGIRGGYLRAYLRLCPTITGEMPYIPSNNPN